MLSARVYTARAVGFSTLRKMPGLSSRCHSAVRKERTASISCRCGRSILSSRYVNLNKEPGASRGKITRFPVCPQDARFRSFLWQMRRME